MNKFGQLFYGQNTYDHNYTELHTNQSCVWLAIF